MGVQTFRDLRAWQSARAFKLSIYRLADSGAFATEDRLRHQLREAAASSASQISEGFGRFDPADFARFVKMARASLIDYLQSPQAKRNAERLRQSRVDRRNRRSNPEP